MQHWDDLRVFLAVARRGTLSAAADELGVNASTLHRRIHALEQREGTVLFLKETRGYALTASGEALLPLAEEVETAVSSAARVLQGHDGNVSGEVRVTLPQSLLSLLAPHLEAFRASCPAVVPVVSVSPQLLQLGHQADVALRTGEASGKGAVGRRIGPLAWGVYGAPDAPWLGYAGLDHVAAVQWQARQRHRVVLRVDEVASMCDLVARGFGRGLLPCYAGELLGLPRLERLPKSEWSELWLLIHRDLRRAAGVRAFVDFIAPRLQAQQALLSGETSRD